MVHGFDSEADRISALRQLIATFEQQIEDDFTFDMKARSRLNKYKKWLRELESEVEA